MVKRNVVVLYSDASVYNNGQPGLQDCYYAVVLADGSHDGLLLKHVGVGDHSVNEGEYLGVIAALRWLHESDLERSGVIITDSKLVYEQVMMNWNCNSVRMAALRDRARRLLEATDAELIWKSRDENKAGWYFEGLIEQRRKAKYRAKKEASRSKRRKVREWTLSNPELSGYRKTKDLPESLSI